MDTEGEAEIRALLDARDFRQATARTVEIYGPEVLGYLARLLLDEDLAADSFAEASADLFSSIERFEGRSSMRTWYYVLAHNAARRVRGAPHRRAGRSTPLSEVGNLVAEVQTRTAPHLRTDAKDRLAEIRASLAPDDRSLLVLRVDRAMSWLEIARVLGEPEETASEASLPRVAARLRKRFQAVKAQIRARAQELGLAPSGGSWNATSR